MAKKFETVSQNMSGPRAKHKDLKAKIINSSLIQHLENFLRQEATKYNKIWHYFQGGPGVTQGPPEVRVI